MRSLLLMLAPLLVAAADPQPTDPALPPPVKAMLDAAMASGNEGEVATVAKYARAAAPEAAALIDRLTVEWREGRRRERERRLREADFLELVKGRIELGAYRSTGNTDNIGLLAAFELRREGLEWRHKLRGRMEYQESQGRVTQERYLAAYEPNWKFDDRAYLYGAAQFERDRFLGYRERYSVSAGIGYSAIRQKGLTLDVELGPAYRNTNFNTGRNQSNMAARGSLDFDWKLNKGVTFSQDASAYVQDTNSTVTSKTALLARLIGPLSAQLSYTVQFESLPPAGRQSTDTTSRAALVVDF
ncbi:YdiY family protein [Sphingomonas canadensis]|uniref:YdiY family protein n=1 Tax=Sphingomonas canadensis TaxID=1219257 RepID=A0ABW3HAV1_9SPHN|nr:DUF481 domain-containing protein [Sphingomonas canadensis]MCW3837906.1 DUF481 domain-containing protein [Sphingomonas canadensis]